jgi:hypothetical protein
VSAAVKTERTWVFVFFMLYHLLNASILFIQPVYDWFNDEYSLTGLYVLLMPYLWGLITILGAILFLSDRSWKYLAGNLLGGSILLFWWLRLASQY